MKKVINEVPKRLYIGLDVSTRSTGIAVIRKNDQGEKEYLISTVVKTPKNKGETMGDWLQRSSSLIEKSMAGVMTFLHAKANKEGWYNPNTPMEAVVGIEEGSGGLAGKATLMKLATWNGMFAYATMNLLKATFSQLSATTTLKVITPRDWQLRCEGFSTSTDRKVGKAQSVKLALTKVNATLEKIGMPLATDMIDDEADAINIAWHIEDCDDKVTVHFNKITNHKNHNYLQKLKKKSIENMNDWQAKLEIEKPKLGSARYKQCVAKIEEYKNKYLEADEKLSALRKKQRETRKYAK